jgi:hypothetical protein
MGIASGAFVPASPARDAASGHASPSISRPSCGSACDGAEALPVGLGALALIAVAAVIAVDRWRDGRLTPGRSRAARAK